jgi:hypothetical protein
MISGDKVSVGAIAGFTQQVPPWLHNLQSVQSQRSVTDLCRFYHVCQVARKDLVVGSGRRSEATDLGAVASWRVDVHSHS